MPKQAAVRAHFPETPCNQSGGAENEAVNPVHGGGQLPQGQKEDEQHGAADDYLPAAPGFPKEKGLLGRGCS